MWDYINNCKFSEENMQYNNVVKDMVNERYNKRNNTIKHEDWRYENYA